MVNTVCVDSHINNKVDNSTLSSYRLHGNIREPLLGQINGRFDNYSTAFLLNNNTEHKHVCDLPSLSITRQEHTMHTECQGVKCPE